MTSVEILRACLRTTTPNPAHPPSFKTSAKKIVACEADPKPKAEGKAKAKVKKEDTVREGCHMMPLRESGGYGIHGPHSAGRVLNLAKIERFGGLFCFRMLKACGLGRAAPWFLKHLKH